MNANEVIATLAGEDVHANDDVNMGQSSNDVFPSAVHLAALGELESDLLPALETLASSLEAKAREFDDVVKSGRTHWMDAVPVTLGQEFAGYAAQVRQGSDARARRDAAPRADPARRHGRRHRAEHASRVRGARARASDRPRPASRSTRRPIPSSRRPRATASSRRPGALKTLAVSLTKIAERPALHGLGPARGPRGDLPAGAPEGQLDHAGQGESGHPGGRDAGRGAGDRQRRGDRDRRHAGPLRAQRLRAAARKEPARLDQAARRAPPGCWPRSASTASRRTRSSSSTTRS